MPIDLRTVLTATKVTDGAWGTELDKLGCPPGYCREQWNLSHPNLVSQVAAFYVQAGSDIILTNTFRANCYALERYGLVEKVESLNRAGAQISRQAAGEKVWVFGSIGPSGKMVAAEEVTEVELYKAFHAQAKALAAGGVDGIVCETMTELAEVLAAVRAAKEATGLPVVASMTFDSGVDYLRTVMGVEAGEAAEQLTRAGADAVGCNCGAGVESYIKLTQCMRQHTALPIWVKPNAGLPEIAADKVVYREAAADFASRAHLLLRAGANFIGGCCGTTPEHITKLVRAIQPWLSAG